MRVATSHSRCKSLSKRQERARVRLAKALMHLEIRGSGDQASCPKGHSVLKAMKVPAAERPVLKRVKSDLSMICAWSKQ